MKKNKWIQHVKDTQKKTGLSYKESMIEAKKTYKRNMEGEGIIDDVRAIGSKAIKTLRKKGIAFLKSRPRKVNALLNSHGNKIIVNFSVCRTPVTKEIQKALNLLSKDSFKKVIKNKSYDDMFHLYLIMTFENGHRVGIEKNEVVRVWYKPPTIRNDSQCKNARVNITLNQLIETAEKSHPNLYRYTPWQFNCQDFIWTLSKIANALPLRSFILQDFSQAFKSNPRLKTLAISLTDLAGISKRIMGAGKKYNT